MKVASETDLCKFIAQWIEYEARQRIYSYILVETKVYAIQPLEKNMIWLYNNNLTECIAIWNQRMEKKYNVHQYLEFENRIEQSTNFSSVLHF